MTHDVLIVGAGLSGLCCALKLQEEGVTCLLLEASDGVGGRIRTDEHDGFRLDRGFQIFLTSYPEARRLLDYHALELRPFLPGAVVRFNGKFYEMADPWRRPIAAVKSLFSPIGTPIDKLRVAGLRSRSLKGTIEERFRDPEITSLQLLREAGFSPSMIDRFFRPFLGGIFLDSELNTSSRMLHFVFRMFSLGKACLPAEGMEAIPRQLASKLLPDSIRLGAKVLSIRPGSVTLASGELLTAKSVVLAVEGCTATELLGDTISSAGQCTTCLYFAAPSSPINRPILVLNGDGKGPINNLCVPTDAADTYGPKGKSLVSVTVLGTNNDANRLLADVRQQLYEWYGNAVKDWRHLRTYSIPYALPAQAPPALIEPTRDVRWQLGIYVCGDHRDNASIQGAMVSGRRAADAVIEDSAG